MINRKVVALSLVLLMTVGVLFTATGQAEAWGIFGDDEEKQEEKVEENGNQGSDEKAKNLSIQGSSTVLPIAQRAAEVYMEKNPEVNITVRGGGSGNGIAALVDGAVDIADASRFIKEGEYDQARDNGIYPVPHRVAMDGIAVVLHPSNSVDGLTLDEIKAIYTGEITNWKELGGEDEEIVVVSRDSSSGTFEVFGEIALEGEKVAPSALMQASNGAVSGTVSETEGAIGYVGLGYLSDDLKAVKVNGVKPSNATVASGAFPIARPLFMFTDGWPEGLTAKFINFVLSAEGQEIAEEQGYVPLH
ncbi:phosphate ABC transporter substrate-binding protein [Acetohalobium arabaticum]|uniref:Phosphate-binding protein n=1 Tax=Acetohalobium arabaticum (strain ATCC 49924 / DSM 5501 / Z-7288) TaxID=574087 RepID=D9QVY4_ACEAZ|nr:phosphate ABC transporter substrate-binding protein [Acetohalobium arabaticum]ADL12393.1 phosphate ABC transporter substrate-binding protein, PhoT family [Acetohalobium arabaticum DSM 5501]